MRKNSVPAIQDVSINTLWRKIVVCILITLVGINLRSVILAVPPVLPLIQHDLGLSYTAAGLLTACPVLMLGLAAWLSGLLAERIGERACVSIGLALLGSGAVLRALWTTSFSLFLFTLLLSLGIALSQTVVPVLVSRWFPAQIGFVAALFSDGLIIGESVAAGLTVPIMAQFLGKDAWNATFILWGTPVIVLLVLWLWLAPPAPATIHTPPGHLSTPITVKDTDSASPRVRVSAWHLGLMLGANSLIYFGMNGWIASYNQAIHYSNLTPLALILLNATQLPASLAVTLFAQRLAGQRWPFIVAGATCAIAIAGWVFAPAPLELFWASVLGACSALVFALGIALPPLLAGPKEVARLTGITFSLTYCVAFVGPFIGGQLWDLFQRPAIAFLPVAAASITLMILGALLPSRAAFGLEA